MLPFLVMVLRNCLFKCGVKWIGFPDFSPLPANVVLTVYCITYSEKENEKKILLKHLLSLVHLLLRVGFFCLFLVGVFFYLFPINVHLAPSELPLTSKGMGLVLKNNGKSHWSKICTNINPSSFPTNPSKCWSCSSVQLLLREKYLIWRHSQLQ